MGYQIISREGNRIRFTADHFLRPGTVLQVAHTNLAVVTNGEAGYYEAILMDDNGPAFFIEGCGCWQPSGLEPKSLVPDIFFYSPDPLHDAVLSVPCASPERRPGRIEWTLYFSFADEDNYVPIVKGTDYRTPRECFFSCKGRWQVGKYRLVAKRYSQPGHFFITEDRAEWVINHRDVQLVLTASDKSDYLDLT